MRKKNNLCDVCHKPMLRMALLSPSIKGPRQMHPDCDPKKREVDQLYREWVKRVSSEEVAWEAKFEELRAKARKIS